MLKFLQKINIENFKTIIAKTYQRMPLAMLISVTTFILIAVIIRLEDISQILEDNLHKAVFSLIVAFFFSISIYLYSESQNIDKFKKWIYQSSTLIFTLLFFYFFEENLFNNFQEETLVYFILTILGVIAFIFIAPFINKLRNKNLSKEEFYISSYALVIKVLMSIIVGVATMLLGFIAFSSIFTLFDINFIDEGNWFGYWATFSLVLFAPIFFLINLPGTNKENQESLENIRSNKFYSFLINYIGLPAIFIYFLILYAYTIKVLMNFSEWPQGEVAWMVILFSFFGYLVYFASYAFTNTFKPAEVLRKILPIAVFLQTFMLFYAIGLRINQYDLTINRYLVLAFGLWLFGLSLYFIISKKKNLATPFYSFLIIIIIISIGPWSVYVVPEQRQQNNLKNNLINAHILQDDGKIIPPKKYDDITGELSGEIYDAIDYLCRYHGKDTLEKYFSLEVAEIKRQDKEDFEENKKERLEQASTELDNKLVESINEQTYREINSWTLIQKLTEKIKVRRYFKDRQENNVLKNLNFINNRRDINESIEINDYEHLVQVSSGNFNKNRITDSFLAETNLPNMYHANLNTINKTLELRFNDDIKETFKIEETVINSLLEKKDNSLESKHNNYEQAIILNEEDMLFILHGESYDLKLVLRNINIKNPEWIAEENDQDYNNGGKEFNGNIRQILDVSHVNGYVLIKQKNNKSE